MRITDARLTKKKRVSVYVDGAFAFAVEAGSWQQSGLSVGCEVDEESLNELLRQSRLDEGKQRALRLLSYKSYTTGQLEDKLSGRVGQEAAGQAIERMQELGLVDDADYAERYAQELFCYKLYGRQRIAQKLRERGIDRELADEVLDALDEQQEAENAVALLQKKLGRTVGLERQKAYALLARYGYRSGVIAHALSVYQFEHEDEEECL